MSAKGRNANRQFIMLTSTRDPYINDVLDLLFLPSGTTYRFRYRKTWFSEEFRDPSVVGKLLNQDALLIHIDVEDIQGGVYPLKEFIPIRKSKIIDVKYLEEVLWISFRLGDWVQYENSSVDGEPNEYHDRIKKITPEGSREKVEEIMYFIDGVEFNQIADYEVVNGFYSEMIINWFKIVSHVEKLDDHKIKNSIFLKLLSVIDLKCGNAIYPINKSKLRNNITHEYEFKYNTEYLIEIIQYYPESDLKPFLYKIVYDDDMFIGLKNSEEIKGRYDVLRYMFKTGKASQSSFSFIKFIKEGASSNAYLISEPFMLVKYVGNKFRQYLIYAGIMVGYIFTEYAKQLADPPVNYGVLTSAALGGFLLAALVYLLSEK